MPDWLSFGWVTYPQWTALITFICGYFLRPLIDKWFGHRFDVKLENLRSEIRRTENALKADLEAKSIEFATLRNSALSGIAENAADLNQRRLDAISKLWKHATSNPALKKMAQATQTIRMEKAIEYAAKDGDVGDKVRRLAEFLANLGQLDNLQQFENPVSDRPFIPPEVWAHYLTYTHALYYPVAQVTLMRTGLDKRFLSDPQSVLNAIEVVLPHQKNFIAAHGVASIPHLLDELEEKLLSVIESNLKTPDTDNAILERSKNILKAITESSYNPPHGMDIPEEFKKPPNDA
ncbi:hypothetical protein [Pseudovibrio exalbescens]|uniref:hypothetical protein n=1 Tax=Pseudovibrio exalbescens TaxID=197461 RepID=UPI000C99BFC5|nr:hypothetical protein [Pseudovibrio exalbescens]